MEGVPAAGADLDAAAEVAIAQAGVEPQPAGGVDGHQVALAVAGEVARGGGLGVDLPAPADADSAREGAVAQARVDVSPGPASAEQWASETFWAHTPTASSTPPIASSGLVVQAKPYSPLSPNATVEVTRG